MLSGNDDEVALLERIHVFDQSDFAELLDEIEDETGVAWLKEYLAEVKTIYAIVVMELRSTSIC